MEIAYVVDLIDYLGIRQFDDIFPAPQSIGLLSMLWD